MEGWKWIIVSAATASMPDDDEPRFEPGTKHTGYCYIPPDYVSCEFPEWAKRAGVFRCFWCRDIFVSFKLYARHAHVCANRPFVHPPF
ncbi:hypothetical protein LPJ61_002592 [Coemansia biformis]|uniref:Uncharacterized protein n=1 Tax=Coemansia biformis TaxID=1286918 RepID=A0A9W8CWB2_9FUNG|nr:hypothetical protein LPJ61_002592 [Coemansia biformis]